MSAVAHVQSDDFDRLLRGGRVALGPLLESCRPDLERRVERVLNGSWLRSRFCPPDIVNDAFVKVLLEFDQFQGTSAAEWNLWIRRITFRVLMDAFRKAGTPTRQIHELASDGSTAAVKELFESTSSVWVKANRNEAKRMLRAAIQDLGSRDRKIVQLRHLKELKWEDVGPQMGCSADAARVRFHREILPALAIRLEFLHDSA